MLIDFEKKTPRALNILRKSSVVALAGLYGRGEVATPMRIRVPRQLIPFGE